jgi:hypothetical protein
VITLSVDDFLWFVDEALAQAVSAVEALGDDLVDQRPDLPGANAPFAIVTHLLGVMEWWGGHAIAGRPVQRDRDAEFVATGTVAELLERIRAARAQLAIDLRSLDPTAPPRGNLDPADAALPLGRTQAGVALHLYEELAQHLGHLQLTSDLLRALHPH